MILQRDYHIERLSDAGYPPSGKPLPWTFQTGCHVASRNHQQLVRPNRPNGAIAIKCSFITTTLTHSGFRPRQYRTTSNGHDSVNMLFERQLFGRFSWQITGRQI